MKEQDCPGGKKPTTSPAPYPGSAMAPADARPTSGVAAERRGLDDDAHRHAAMGVEKNSIDEQGTKYGDCQDPYRPFLRGPSVGNAV